MRIKKPIGGKRNYHWPKLGNVDMKGKTSITLSCGCCTARNFKWSERWKEAMKEIRKGYKGMVTLSETEK